MPADTAAAGHLAVAFAHQAPEQTAGDAPSDGTAVVVRRRRRLLHLLVFGPAALAGARHGLAHRRHVDHGRERLEGVHGGGGKQRSGENKPMHFHKINLL
jgi:hypothetical protein